MTILVCRTDEIYSHLIYMYYKLSSVIFPQNACIHSVLIIKILSFQQKNLFESLTGKIRSLLRPTDAFHLCKLISKNSRPVHSLLRPADAFHLCKLISKNSKPVYLSKTYLKSYSKLFFFQTKVNIGKIFFIWNLCPSYRKAVAFLSLQLYIVIIITGHSVISIYIYKGFPASYAHGTQISKKYPM